MGKRKKEKITPPTIASKFQKKRGFTTRKRKKERDEKGEKHLQYVDREKQKHAWKRD